VEVDDRVDSVSGALTQERRRGADGIEANEETGTACISPFVVACGQNVRSHPIKMLQAFFLEDSRVEVIFKVSVVDLSEE
jgi:hypothetical protein